MMYYCHYTFEAAQHPKFLDGAIRLLTDARHKMFLDRNDVKVLAVRVREALEAARPKGSTAHVSTDVPDRGDICIYVYNGDAGYNSVGRAHFSPVRAFVTFDPDKQQFIGVKLKMEEPKQ